LQHYKKCYQDHVDRAQNGEHVNSESRWAGSLKPISLYLFLAFEVVKGGTAWVYRHIA
jgi:hypothetical protein